LEIKGSYHQIGIGEYDKEVLQKLQKRLVESTLSAAPQQEGSKRFMKRLISLKRVSFRQQNILKRATTINTFWALG